LLLATHRSCDQSSQQAQASEQQASSQQHSAQQASLQHASSQQQSSQQQQEADAAGATAGACGAAAKRRPADAAMSMALRVNMVISIGSFGAVCGLEMDGWPRAGTSGCGD
jgi:hypothetical protein